MVAGHICLDILPLLRSSGSPLDRLIQPGHLLAIEATRFSVGGAVGNTGLALAKLGIEVRLVGKVGDDLFGTEIRERLASTAPSLAGSLIVSPGDATSYSIVLGSAEFDRSFLHFGGANDTFASVEIPDRSFEGASLFHFGYPPALRRFSQNQGEELVELLTRAKRAGLTTSLDMSYPPAQGPAVDWRALLERVLPFVDIFLPALEEMRMILGEAPLPELAARLVDMGCAIAGFKLGSAGLYIQTTHDTARIRSMGRAAPEDPGAWAGRETCAPCFEVTVAGTTGAGDCTIAGFLAALLRGLPFDDAVTTALAVGACSVEGVDATSAIPSWEGLRGRIASGWPRRKQP